MYRYEISKDDIKSVKKALKILTELKAPISKNITFGYTGGKTCYGTCSYKNNRYYVLFRPDFLNDYYKTNTIIHEILHTILDEDCYYDHRGEWAKWAKVVTKATIYKIKSHAEGNELKYEYKNIPTKYIKKYENTKKSYCPYCGKVYDIPLTGRNYWCPKCIKPLFKTLQKDELSKLSIKDRQNEISLHMAELNIENAPKLLLYANKTNTRKIIINLMLKYPLDDKLKNIIESYISVYTKHTITELCDKGAFNNFITSFKIMMNYQFISDTKADLFKTFLGF